MYRVKPSKPAAVFGAVVGAAILIVGITTMKHFSAFYAIWLLVGIGIIAFNLWAAFSAHGSVYSMQGPGLGQRVERDPNR